jgi:transcription termination/antitermination protein NusG
MTDQNDAKSIDETIAEADATIQQADPAPEAPAEEAVVTEEAAPAEAPAEAPAPDVKMVGDQPLVAPGMVWTVLRVASNKEDMVRETLVRKVKMEGLAGSVNRILVPTEKRPVQRGRGKAKMVERKLYPGYVFVEVKLDSNGSIDEKTWFAIKETTGVGDFIGAGGKPAPMGLDDVEKMLLQVVKAQEGAPVTVEFEAGQTVKIKEGPFENIEGSVDEVLPDKGLVRVVVTIFGRSTPVELEYWQVEKV